MIKEKGEKRFELVYREGSAMTIGYRKILVDRETGVNYLIIESGYASAITPLLDKDGKPIVTK